MRYPAEIAGHCRLRGVMSPGTIRYEDIRTLKEWNVNLIRAQLSRNWGKVGTELDLEEYDRWLNGKLDDLERAMDWAKEAGIKFVIDLHCLPGGRNLNSNMRMFAEKKYGDHFIEVWKRIASRFKDHPQLYAYDLVNEPLQSVPAPEGYDYWNLQRRAAEAVRKIDGRTPIMIESNMADKPWRRSLIFPRWPWITSFIKSICTLRTASRISAWRGKGRSSLIPAESTGKCGTGRESAGS